ncbi:DUF296 domain-containing protein [Paraburkholderia sp. MPAMCS5]|uniref:PCC domain-containing protein n=1 Tax=Paraburkholderia sp. MPAMCS5 TaxID=3112563 RepID=UPI002E18B294|nr:DUF296 domain-containing protein [Paraburkholderia sp. MPAMCS5]
MRTTSRLLTQPGMPAAERIESICGDALALTFDLQPGDSLRDALCAPLEAAGLSTATVRIEGLRLESLHYVRPALPNDAEHVAFYSEQHRIDTSLHVELACATIGRRDGAPFVHCHAVWKTPEGRWQGGHIFSDQVRVAKPSQARAWGTSNAWMQAEFDSETNFTLLRPVVLSRESARGTAAGRLVPNRKCVVARIRPNEDLVGAIEQTCRNHDIRAAKIRGSVGSIVGARFENAPPIDDVATEILVVNGEVHDTQDGPRATIDIALIDPRGDVHRGRLVRGDNPVLICFELYLEETLL